MFKTLDIEGRAPVHVADHPIIYEHLAAMRAETTPNGVFWQHMQQIAPALFWAATAHLPTATTHVKTPLEIATVSVLSGNFCMIGVARAGFGMDAPCKSLYPPMLNGYIDAHRDEETLKTVVTSIKLPKGTHGLPAIVYDPMLASGNTAITSVRAAFEDGGASDVTFMSLLSAPEGIEALHAEFPNTPIITGAVDKGLNKAGYIVPGLGDAGDRMFGEKDTPPAPEAPPEE